MSRVANIARFAVIAASLAVLGACESRTVWVKESAPAGQLAIDQRDCTRAASGYGYVERGSSTGLDDGRAMGGSGSVSADSYRRCMEQRGWRRERQGETTPAGSQRT